MSQSENHKEYYPYYLRKSERNQFEKRTISKQMHVQYGIGEIIRILFEKNNE